MEAGATVRSKRARDGALIWGASLGTVALSLCICLVLLPVFWAFWTLATNEIAAGSAPRFVLAAEHVFVTAAFGVLGVGALYGVFTSLVLFFGRQPVLRIDDAGLSLRNLYHLSDLQRPRFVRWSEIKAVLHEADPRQNRRVLWSIFLEIDQNGQCAVWTINAPLLGEESKALADFLTQVWSARRGV